MTVSEWLPSARLLTVMDPDPLPRMAVPMVVAPSLNVTVPVAVDGVTVAVSSTPLPKPAGFGDAVSAVVVEYLLMLVFLDYTFYYLNRYDLYDQ